MNKQEFIKKVAEAQGLSQKETTPIVEEVFNQIVVAMQNGEKVSIAKFGDFVAKEVQAGTRLNPSKLKELKDAGVPAEDAKLQAQVEVEAHYKPTFKASSKLKEAVR